jgi:hypothetical protein
MQIGYRDKSNKLRPKPLHAGENWSCEGHADNRDSFRWSRQTGVGVEPQRTRPQLTT